MKPIEIPDDPTARFHELYDALSVDRKWFQGATTLRFAAMTAICCSGRPREIATRIRTIAEEIEEATSWLGPFKSDLRFVVASMLLLHGDRAADMLREVKRVQRFFREKKLRRGGIYEALAILVLRMQRDGEAISKTDVDRFGALYEEMKRHHWWLTGPDDFPACAILVDREGTPKAIGEGIEAIYQELRGAGFSQGDPLQTAANILYLAKKPAHELALRYATLANEFKAADVSIWQSDYDELAILSFLEHRPSEIVRRVVRLRRDIDKLKPSPGRLMTFNLAASLVFLELVQLDADLHSITDTKALLDMQAVIQAQQAAAVAAATSASTAAAASSN